MKTLEQYKCPCCGGTIEFDTSSQKPKCPYCDTEFDIETLISYNDEIKKDDSDKMDWDENSGNEWQESEEEKLTRYICNTCGGEVIGDENTAATSCPFCGNPVIVVGKLSGSLKPDIVIPFKVDKKQAKEALKKYYSGKRLLPKAFKDENHLDEIKGIYVPFWLFDTNAKASVRYRASKTRFWSDSRFNYTETSYFSVIRDGTLDFTNVPVDGSSKIDDALMESIEPFDMSDAVDFHTAYLSGYLADKYDVDSAECISRANQRIKQSTEDVFSSTVHGYSSVVTENSNINFSNGAYKYALLPVWILNTNWNGEKYIFAMNGQTGKMTGDLPLDKKAYYKWLFSLAGIISAGIFALTALINLL